MKTNLSSLIGSLSATDVATRSRAVEQLAQLGPDARPAAIALVLACGDESEEVREFAAAALEEMGPPEATDVEQLASLVEARSSDVGYWAASLLGRLKHEAAPAAESLAKAIVGNGDLAVRQRAAWALGEIGPAAPRAIPALQKAAGNPDPRLSRLAQGAIRQISAQ